MARKPEIPDITTGGALAFIKNRFEHEMMWRIKAAQLLQFFADGEGDLNKLRESAKKHAEDGFNL